MTIDRGSARRMLFASLLASISTLPGHCLAAGSQDALRLLSGRWFGDGLQLRVDTTRLQANVDLAKPFEWKSLTIKNVSGNMVLFRIGRTSYIAIVTPGSMVVTSDTFEGPRTLAHVSGEP